MTMTGKNGINIKPEKLIVLFDSSASLDEIKSIFKSKRSVIISLNHPSFEILKKNNIPQISPDEFLTQDEMEIIQKSVYELSDWYSHYEEKYNDLMYNDVNLGSILQSELINILVNFIKNFYVIYKITKKYNLLASIGEEDLEFFCSENTSKFLDVMQDGKNWDECSPDVKAIKYYLLKSLKIDDIFVFCIFNSLIVSGNNGNLFNDLLVG